MKTLDQTLSKKLYAWAHHSPLVLRWMKVGATFLIFLMGLIAAILAWQTGGWRAFETLSLSTVSAWFVTFCLQMLVRRQRPFECNIYEAKVKMFCKTPSFPSAHSTISFALASAIYMQHNMMAFVVFFLAAIWIALSRVAVGVHYVSDIVVGALIGMLIPFLFVCGAVCLSL